MDKPICVHLAARCCGAEGSKTADTHDYLVESSVYLTHARHRIYNLQMFFFIRLQFRPVDLRSSNSLHAPYGLGYRVVYWNLALFLSQYRSSI